MNKWSFALLSGLVLLQGCGRATIEPKPTTTPVAVVFPSPVEETPSVDLVAFADEAIKKKAAELLAEHTGNAFQSKVLGKKENAKAFLYLAATSEDPKVAGDALRALRFTFDSNPKNDSREFAGEFYAPVVLHHLKGENKALVVSALESSVHGLGKEPHPELLQEVLRLGAESPEVEIRFGALSALASYGGRGKDAKVNELYLKAFQDEPLVAGKALQWSSGALAKGEKKDLFMGKYTELSKHEHPLVRGMAAQAAAATYPFEEEYVIGLAEPLLKDSSPYVRGKALGALGGMRDKRVFAMLETLLDDQAETDLVVEYKGVDGKDKKEKFTTFGNRRVDGMAVKEIGTASFLQLDKDKKFKPGKVGFKTKDEDMAKNVKATKEWLAKNKDAIAALEQK